MFRYIKFNDGWFSYYVDVDTGKKKFKMDDGDIVLSDLDIIHKDREGENNGKYNCSGINY